MTRLMAEDEEPCSGIRKIGYVDVYDWTDTAVNFTVSRSLLEPEHGDILLEAMRKCPVKGSRRFERIVVAKGSPVA